MKSLIIPKRASISGFTISIPWNPTMSNRPSIWTPCLTNICAKSCCRSINGSPQNPITRHLPILLMALVCGPSTIGLEYQWSRSSPSGNDSSKIKSSTHKGRTWSIGFISSEFVLCMPPKMGWFIIFPAILRVATPFPLLLTQWKMLCSHHYHFHIDNNSKYLRNL